MSNKVCAILWCAVLAMPAATSWSEESEPLIEEVIVTATYRETSLMDTPQAISAVTSSLVEDMGAQSMEDIYTMIPGLSMQGAQSGNNRYTIRGVTSQTGETGYYITSAMIGVYLDGTPVTAALGPDNQISGQLFDLERVEVLKGPQGTLFGEGSQGGTIRYLYNQPDPDGFDFAMNASLSHMEESDDMSNRLDVMVNVPLGDSAALRVSAWDSTTAGYIDNLSPFEKDYNEAESTGIRSALRYEGESWSLTGTIFHSAQETFGGVQTLRAYEASSARIPGLPPEAKDELDIFSLNFDYDFGWASFTSLTSFTDREIVSRSEFSTETVWLLDYFYGGATLAANSPGCAVISTLCPTFPGFFNLGDPNATIPDGNNLTALVNFGDSYSERWVQEFRLVSPGENRLRWTVGAFWKDSEDHTQNQQQGAYPIGREGFGARFDALLQVPANTHTDYLEEYAVFGEVSYDLTEKLEVTLGVRVSDLEQDFSNTNSGTDDTPVSPKLVFAWRPIEDLMLYASYTTGFRPGNVNNHMEFNFRQYEGLIQDALNAPGLTPEERQSRADRLRSDQEVARSRRFFDGDELDNYEIGLKTALWDGRVQLQASVYYLDWEDMIVVEDDPVVGQSNPLNFYNTNSGGAEIQGFELEATAFLTDRLSIRISGDVNDTEVTESPLFSDGSPDGNELIYSPNNSLAVALDYSVPLDGWMLDFHVDRSWVAEQFSDTQNTLIVPEYEKSNARITLRSSDEQWRIALYATNLENEEIMRGRDGQTTFFWHSPRQIGLEVGYQLANR